MSRTVAVLFADPDGVYSRRQLSFGAVTPVRVDVWAPPRDAREYAGPHPVVAHPPCTRWCRLAGLVQARWGHKIGDDDGCFEAALAAIRAFGGVLEHPAYSMAWADKHGGRWEYRFGGPVGFGLARPPTSGGWVPAGDGGFTCRVEQGRYGHPAKKATYLLAHGIPRERLPELRWGHAPDKSSRAWVSWCGNRATERRMVSRLWREEPREGVPADKRRRLSGKAAAATPPEFAEVLLDIASRVVRLAQRG